MREIKYQAWDRKRKVMFQVVLFDLDDYSVYSNIFGNGIDAEECDIREFTGLIDINNVEIYTGDIVKFKMDDDSFAAMPAEGVTSVYFDVRYSAYMTKKSHLGLAWYETLEVVGNIYQNPELLEGEDE